MKMATEIQPKVMRNSEKIQSIQELRAVGFLLIFVSHYPFTYCNTTYLGALGVQIFIFISGFLIAINKDKNLHVLSLQNVSIKIRKLYPLHVATFLISLPVSGLIAVVCGEYSIPRFGIKVVINLSMMQAFFPVKSIYFSFNAVSWYLTLVILFAVMSRLMLKITSDMYRRIRGGGYLAALWYGNYLVPVGGTIA